MKVSQETIDNNHVRIPIMNKLIELIIVLLAITIPPALLSGAGDNYNRHDATRAVKITGSQAAILGAYGIFARRGKDATT